MIILDLCSGSGAWSKPYKKAGYIVESIDLSQGKDIRITPLPSLHVHGILCAPPCTHLAVSGARWWPEKGERALLDALSVVDACLRFVALCEPAWWALENPVGRLRDYLGPPSMSFNPYDYGDPYTKKTLLWGRFTKPTVQPVHPAEGSKMHKLGPSPERAAQRSVTPAGFAQAFFEANP